MLNVKDSPFLKKLYETDRFIAGNIFEEGYLIDKKTRKQFFLGYFYGDPTCAIVSVANNWCIIAGNTLYIWWNKEIISLEQDVNLKWIVEARQSGVNTVDLLIDPYSENGAVWQLNITTLNSHKLKDYKKADEAYIENFDW